MNWDRRAFASSLLTASLGRLLPPLWRLLIGSPPATRPPFSRFTDIAIAAGLTSPTIYGGLEHVTYIIESVGGGCAFFDYDNDGWMDIFIVGGVRLDGVPPDATNRLYKNNRDGTFTDVTEKAGLRNAGWANGVCVGDYNNDGHEDLFITYFGHNKLYRNNGDGSFTDVTEKAGLSDPNVRFATGCSFFDYDRDGFLDLFVANYVQFDIEHAPKPSAASPTCSYEGLPVMCGPRGLKPAYHSLYHNNGTGTFSDVSKAAGISAFHGSYGLTAVTADLDDDGWPDIFVACDSTPSLLFMNNHDGTFREEALARGVAVSGEGRESAGMGVGVGDYELRGYADIFKTHFQREPGGLYRNSGKGDFDDVTGPSMIGREKRYVSWGTCILDLDNDGYPDIFVATGNVYPEVEKVYPQLPYKGPRMIFRNLGDGRFEELIEEAGPGVYARHSSRGCAFGDFDNDGDVDIVIMNVNEAPSLLRNDAPQQNQWLKLKLIGTKSNRSAIGARVLVRYGKKVQAQQLLSQSSYLSSNDPRLHFGLGDEKIAQIEIRWPNGLQESITNVAANQLVIIKEGAGVIEQKALRPAKVSGAEPR
jgi:hypothetical protein